MNSSLFIKATIMDMGVARFALLLAFFTIVDHQILSSHAASCGPSKLRYVFKLQSSLNEFDNLLKLVQSMKSASIKRFENDGLPIHVVVKPEDFHKFYRKSRSLKVYRSHWTKCLETNKSKSPSGFNLEPIIALPSNEHTNNEKDTKFSFLSPVTENKNLMNINEMDDSEIFRSEKLANDMDRSILVNQSAIPKEDAFIRDQYLTTMREFAKRKPKLGRFIPEKQIHWAKFKKCSFTNGKCKNGALNVTKKFLNPRSVVAKNIRKMRFIPPYADRQRLSHKMKVKNMSQEDKPSLRLTRRPERLYQSTVENKMGQAPKTLHLRKSTDRKNKLKKKKMDTLKKKMEKRLNDRRLQKVTTPERKTMEQKKKKRNIITKVFRKISKRTVSISNVEESRMQSTANHAALPSRPILELMGTNSTVQQRLPMKFQEIDRESERGSRNVMVGQLKEDEMVLKRNVSSMPRKARRPIIMRKKYMHHVPRGGRVEKHKSFRAGASENQRTLNSAGNERIKWPSLFGKEKKLNILKKKRENPRNLNIQEFESREHFGKEQILTGGRQNELDSSSLEGEVVSKN